jgi:hypothetical protein
MRVDLERFADQPFRVLELAELRMDITKQVQRVKIVRIVPQDFPAKAHRFRTVSGLICAPRLLD